MAKDLLLTLDVGTTGLKCAVFDRDGNAVACVVEEYSCYFPHSGWSQQKPEEQRDAAIRAIRSVLNEVDGSRLAAIGLCGTMNGCLPIDREGNAIAPNIIHSDARTAAEVDLIRETVGKEAYYRLTGNLPDVHSGFPKYMWLKKNQPDVYKNAYKFVNIKDYIYGQITGVVGCTDRSDASLCNCLNITTGDWAWDLLKEMGVDADKMPELRRSCDVSGSVSADFAALTGLPQGLPVAIGGGDGTCAAHGGTRQEPGAAYINIGSSAWMSLVTDHPVLDDKTRIFNYFDLDENKYDVCGTVQSGAIAFDWAVKNLLCPGQKPDYAELEAACLQSPVGANGLFYLPTLMGERTPWWTARISGTLMGFTLFHQRSDVTRAVYEGIMQSLRMVGSVLDENKIPVSTIMLIGGGAKSNIWPQMCASTFNVPVTVHQTARHATSLGAAAAAGVGIGMFKDYKDAGCLVKAKSTYQPIPEEVEPYRRHLEVYRTLYPNMVHAYEAIYDYQNR